MPSPDGLHGIDDYISPDEAATLLTHVDAAEWRNPFKRRVQHYGYVYDYRKRHVDADMYLGALPAWLQTIAQRLHADGWMPAPPDQVIINEYEPGQGISPHVDCEPCFGDVIASLSVGSACVMDFSHIARDETHSVVLAPRSLLVMRGSARYDWQHGIAARKTDLIDGQRRYRQRRVSLTFRKVVLS